MTVKDFEDMFFKVITNWSIYDTQVIRNKMLFE